MVDGNGVKPCVKCALTVEVAQGPVGFGKRFLGDVIGIVVVVRHLVQRGMELTAVADHQLVKSTGISFPSSGDQFSVFQGRIINGARHIRRRLPKNRGGLQGQIVCTAPFTLKPAHVCHINCGVAARRGIVARKIPVPAGSFNGGVEVFDGLEDDFHRARCVVRSDQAGDFP